MREIVYLGDRLHAVVTLDAGGEGLAAARGGGDPGWRRGDRVTLVWDPSDARPLEAEP